MIEILILPEIDQLVTRLITFCVTGRVHLSQYCTSSTEIATYNLQRSPDSPRRLPVGNLESLSQHYKLGLFVLDISLQTIYGNDKFHRKFNTPSSILIHIHTYVTLFRKCSRKSSVASYQKPCTKLSEFSFSRVR